MVTGQMGLPRRLREVAHKADVEAHNRAILAVIAKRLSREEKAAVVSWTRSSATAAAVLRELATEHDHGMVPHLAGPYYRALADSIEKGA